MTRFIRPSDGQKVIKWDPGDPVDWTTPDSDWRDHWFCGNCGLDKPGCGCPRDEHFDGDASALPVQKPGDDPLPYEYQGPIP